MTKPMVRIHNSQTDELIDREMNADEFAAYETAQAEQETRKAGQGAKDALKQAVIDKLGLSADEVAALIS